MKYFISIFMILVVCIPNLYSEDMPNNTLTIEEKQWVKHNIVIIGIEQWEPIVYLNQNTNKIEGSAGSIISQVIKYLNLQVTIKSAKWYKLYDDFRQKKIDILPATYYDEKRLKYGVYSTKYFDVHKPTEIKQIYFLTNKSQPILNTIIQKALNYIQNQELLKKEKVIQSKILKEIIKKEIIKEVIIEKEVTPKILIKPQSIEKQTKQSDSQIEQSLYLKYLIIIMMLGIVAVIVKQIILYRKNKSLEVVTQQQNQELQDAKNELEKSIDIISKNVNYSKTDTKGIITYVSEKFCEISGYTKDEALGRPHNIVRHPDMPSSAFKIMWSTIKKGEIWSGQVKNKKKDGNFFWSQATITPEYDKNNKIKGYISIRQDLTIKKELQDLTDHLQEKVNEEVAKSRKIEEQLFQSEKLASMGEMIGNISHQWRQPLSTISTASSGMLMQKEYGLLSDDDFEKSCNLIVSNTDYLSKTIETFTNFIKDDKESKKVIIQNRIDEAITIIVSSLDISQIKLINNIDYAVPIYITLIVGELSQVIINIINNAKDILVENNITEPWITLNMEVEEDKIIITIEDNAGGIPVDILPKIFEPYFTTKHQSQGTGLGLHMSYTIITQSLNGNLYAKNTSNGAKFFIELPLS